MKNKVFNILKYILVFIIPVFLVLSYIIYKEITVGKYILDGENFLLVDMASQYNSIYNYIWDVLRGTESIFYSFGKSLGGNMASTIAYYASSPLNIFYLFCSKVNIPLMTFILYLIKIGLSSLFTYIFLNYKFDNKNSNMIFAVIYSLIGYTINLYFNSMWLDIVALTPLVLLGIEKLIKEKKYFFYSIFLGLSIISNFYISYMLCIFVLIYFIYQILLNYKLSNFKSYKSILLKFVIGTILGVGISSVLLIPAVLNLSEIIRAPIDVSYFDMSLTNPLNNFVNNFLAKLYIGSHNLSSHLGRLAPNLYCSVLVIVLNVYYYSNKKINLKERILSFGILLIFIASFMIPHVNFFFHGFAIPNGYIGRFSFLFNFYLLLIAVKSFKDLEKINIWKIIVFIIIYCLISYRIYLNIHDFESPIHFITNKSIMITSIFISIYLFILTLMTYVNKRKFKNILRIIIYISVIFELFINFKMCFITNKDLNSFGSPREYYTEVCPIINNLEESFYRVDGSYKYSLLDSFICNTKTYSSSLSTNDGNLYRFWKENGGNITYTTIFYDLNKLPIFDSIFGVKYIKSDYELEDSLYEKYLDFTISGFNGYDKNETKKYLYKNPYALSLGYLIPKDYSKIYKSKKVSNSFESLNRLMKTMSGNDEDVLKPYTQRNINNGEYKFNIDNDEPYIYLSFDYNIYTNSEQYFPIFINGVYITSASSENIGIIKIENKYANEIIDIQLGQDEKSPIMDTISAYYFDKNVFEKDIKLIKKNQLTNIKIHGNKIEGDIKNDSDGVLFMSIPYDRGWRVYIDGTKTSYEKVIGEFVGINIKNGKHSIKMIYRPPGFITGLVTTVISIILLLIFKTFGGSYDKRKR